MAAFGKSNNPQGKNQYSNGGGRTINIKTGSLPSISVGAGPRAKALMARADMAKKRASRIKPGSFPKLKITKGRAPQVNVKVKTLKITKGSLPTLSVGLGARGKSLVNAFNRLRSTRLTINGK